MARASSKPSLQIAGDTSACGRHDPSQTLGRGRIARATGCRTPIQAGVLLPSSCVPSSHSAAVLMEQAANAIAAFLCRSTSPGRYFTRMSSSLRPAAWNRRGLGANVDDRERAHAGMARPLKPVVLNSQH